MKSGVNELWKQFLKFVKTTAGMIITALSAVILIELIVVLILACSGNKKNEKKDSGSYAYAAYSKEVDRLTALYGKGQITDDYLLKGLAYVDLRDLDEDGTEEMICAYGKDYANRCTVYTYSDVLLRLYDGSTSNIGNGVYPSVEYLNKDGETEFVHCESSDSTVYYRLADNKFENAMSYRYSEYSGGAFINDLHVTMDAADAELEKHEFDATRESILLYSYLEEKEEREEELDAVIEKSKITTEFIIKEAAPVIKDEKKNEKEDREQSVYTWVVDPFIEADNIDVLGREHWIYADMDLNIEDFGYNSFMLPVYDDICVVEKDNKKGLVSYSGEFYADVEYDYVNPYASDMVLYGKIIEEMYYNEDFDEFYTSTDYDGYSFSLRDPNTVTEKSMDFSQAGGVGVTWSNKYKTLYWITDGGFWENKTDRYVVAENAVKEKNYESGVNYYDELDEYDEWCLFDYNSNGYVITKDGQRISDEIYDYGTAYSEGLFAVMKDGYWGYVDEKGNVVIPFEFDSCWKYNNCEIGSYFEEYMEWWEDDNIMYPAYPAIDGYVPVCKDGEYALYDINGNIIIDFGELETIRPMYKGMFWAEKDGLWGVATLNYDAIDIVLPDSDKEDSSDATTTTTTIPTTTTTKSKKEELAFLPMRFVYTSGMGNWVSVLDLNKDLSFTGAYDDIDMGDFSDDYPEGTAYTCEFSGKFGNLKKINDYTYSMELIELETKEKPGKEWIEHGIKYYATEAAGIDGCEEFFLYTPDAPTYELSEEFLWYGPWLYDGEIGDELNYYGIYNPQDDIGFFHFPE